MSRSYKHTPYCGGKNKFSKNQANRKVRRNKMNLSLPKSGYKKVYCSWEEYWQRELDWYYCDHYSRYHRAETPPDYKEEYCNWHRYYKMK